MNIGEKFNKLTAIKRIGMVNDNHCWLFKCDCGNIKTIKDYHVKTGRVKSCGCWIPQHKSHKMSTTKFYHSWSSMKMRCLNSNSQSYKWYGNIGITVCDQWIKFENFRDDMYESYLKHVKIFGDCNTTLDRINSRGDYELKNCRWVTKQLQAINRTSNRFITFRGETLCKSAMARKYGIDRKIFHARIKLGWGVERALTQPVNR